MSLMAEALSLSFCPLGITGHPYLTDFLPMGPTAPKLMAVGIAVVGAPA